MSSLTPSRYYARVFGLATAVVLSFLLVRLLLPFAAPMMWAFLLAFMLQPANNRLLTRWPTKPGLAAGLLTLASLVVVAGPITLVVFAFLRQAVVHNNQPHQHVGGPGGHERVNLPPFLRGLGF